MLSDEFDHRLLEDREEVDLLIVIGTSLRVGLTIQGIPAAQACMLIRRLPTSVQVSPVAQIVSHLPHSVPQILINRDAISHAMFDVMLLGDGDTIVKYLCSRLNALNIDQQGADDQAKSPATPPWQLPPPPNRAGPTPPLTVVGEHVQDEMSVRDIVPERVAESHVWLFPGANPGRWVELVRQAYEDPSSGDDLEEEAGDDERINISAVDRPLNLGGDSKDDAEATAGVGHMSATTLPGGSALQVPLKAAESRLRSRSPDASIASDQEQQGKKVKLE